MKVALIGRTRELINTGNELIRRGHEIVVVAATKTEAYSILKSRIQGLCT